MVTETTAPHGRWLLRDSVDRLAASHAVIVAATAGLGRAAEQVAADRVAVALAPVRPRLRYRIAGQRGWPRTGCLLLTVAATAVFLSWLSASLVMHLSAVPTAIAFLPGLVLTLALAGAAGHASEQPRCRAADPVRRDAAEPGTEDLAGAATTGDDPWLPRPTRPWLPLAVAAVAAVVWIVLWLYLVAGAVLGAAVAAGLALTTAIVAALVSCLYPATSPGRPPLAITNGTPVPARTPRPLRARQGKARRLLQDHSRRWYEVAHRYGATLDDGSPAATALTRLLTGEENLSLGGLGAFDTLILSMLRKYNPTGLAEDLDSIAIP